MNEERFDVWEEKVLQKWLASYSKDILFLVLTNSYTQFHAQSLVEKYPQILQYQTNPSPSLRCAFSSFARWLDTEKETEILNAMQKAETDSFVIRCMSGI